MKMKPKARLKVTLECNKKCSYCINKNKDYRDKWTKIDSVYDVKWQKYRSIVISGGEPLMNNSLCNILCVLRTLTPIPIYLQTNGILLRKSFIKTLDDCIDGIGISVHNLKQFQHLYTRFKDILTVKPIKLYVEKDTVEYGYTSRWIHDGFTVREWTDGEFDKTEEIFVLKNAK
jgi:molybdenum cofactor biosynthesis enzyme MoaA